MRPCEWLRMASSCVCFFVIVAVLVLGRLRHIQPFPNIVSDIFMLGILLFTSIVVLLWRGGWCGHYTKNEIVTGCRPTLIMLPKAFVSRIKTLCSNRKL